MGLHLDSDGVCLDFPVVEKIVDLLSTLKISKYATPFPCMLIPVSANQLPHIFFGLCDLNHLLCSVRVGRSYEDNPAMSSDERNRTKKGAEEFAFWQVWFSLHPVSFRSCPSSDTHAFVCLSGS